MNQFHKVILLIFFTASLNAQSLEDVIRYSTPNHNGTARFTAMGGAFGALGGDLSALQVNPASSSVFEHSQIGVSMNSGSNKINSNYYDTGFDTSSNNFDFDQFGFVFVLKNSEVSLWSKISFSFDYQKKANFSSFFEAEGYNPNGIDNYFLNFAQGVTLENFQTTQRESISELYSYLGENFGFDEQQGFLGYQSYMIEANLDEPLNTEYYSTVNPASNGYFHEYVTSRSGGINKYAFNFSGEYKKKYYFGLNLNSYNLEYIEQTDFYESNYSNTSALNSFRFNNKLLTLGKGFSFQIGAITKLTEQLRLGLSYESPTWFSIIEETEQFVASNDGSGITVEPNVINIYPEYRFRTPLKYTGSLAYIFGKKGLISFDYTRIDYDSANYNEPNDNYFQDQNDVIKNNLSTEGILKIGGEYRFGNYSLRAGYVKQNAFLKNFDNSGSIISIGGGINFGGSSLDFSITSSDFNDQQQLFSSGLTDTINLKKDQLNFRFTYILKL
jgi:hypothetical protein